jgi:hypothetical protein
VCSPRLSLAEVFIFSLMLSQALFMFWSVKISIATNLFVTSFCYSFLASSPFSFFILNLSQSNFCGTCLLTAKLSLTFQPPGRDQFHNQVPWNFVHLVCSNAISFLWEYDHSGCESSYLERSRCIYENFSVGTSCS